MIITNKYIELFAGCGGMSIGLEAAGYKLLFANELSPMAGETFAFNILNEDLEHLGKNLLTSEKVYWLSSQYERSSILDRLRENPIEAKLGYHRDPIFNQGFLDSSKLIIGDINKLIDQIETDSRLLDNVKNLDIDIVSGGPPCQSFSLAGLREKNNQRNTLPLSFAKFVNLIRPKVVLLENVEGITAPFKEKDKYYYAWLEVAKAFSLFSYYTVCILLNSKYLEIPQNRPRFILFAFRQDIFTALEKSNLSIESKDILKYSSVFTSLCLKNKADIDKVTINDFRLFDIENVKDRPFFNGELLPRFIESNFVSVSEAIDDIKSIKEEYNLNELNKGYSKKLNSFFNTYDDLYLRQHYLQNHLPRKHNDVVKARFRIYQLLNKFENGQRKKILNAIKGDSTDQESIFKILKGQKVYFDGKRQYLKTPDEAAIFFNRIKSKKQAQRALIANLPSPAQLTIPDDVCHYDKNQLRTLTVREMARIQTFPDWFEFKAKITTGGKLRKFEVPQYTQVGNAVPPVLAYELGTLIRNIINKGNGTI